MKLNEAQLLLIEQCRPLTHQGYVVRPEWRFAPPRRWRIDVAVLHSFDAPAPVLAVEIQGGVHVAGRHSRGAGQEKEFEKFAALAAHGYRLICATPKQVKSGQAWAWIQAALREGA